MKILIWHRTSDNTYWIQYTDQDGTTEAKELTKEQFRELSIIIADELETF